MCWFHLCVIRFGFSFQFVVIIWFWIVSWQRIVWVVVQFRFSFFYSLTTYCFIHFHCIHVQCIHFFSFGVCLFYALWIWYSCCMFFPSVMCFEFCAFDLSSIVCYTLSTKMALLVYELFVETYLFVCFKLCLLFFLLSFLFCQKGRNDFILFYTMCIQCRENITPYR